MIGIAVVPVVTEYHAAEFYDKKKGRKVHSAFPDGVTDDVNYDESMRAVQGRVQSISADVRIQIQPSPVPVKLIHFYLNRKHPESPGRRVDCLLVFV